MGIIEKAIERMHEQHPMGAPRMTDPPGTSGKVTTSVSRAPDLVRPATRPVRIVEIDEHSLRSAGLLPPEYQARQIARQYREIKRPLIASALGRGAARIPDGQLILLASALPSEGKTFTALNLALSLSLEREVQVLLVDGDVMKRHISRLLGVAGEPGLLDVLEDPGRDIESAILPTSVRGLSVLPAGPPNENATELLASERMRSVASRMVKAHPNRIVLFDSPPLQLATESHALAQTAAQIVVVVRAGMTLQRDVLDALSLIPEGKHVSLVLNQSVTASTGYYQYETDAGGSQSARSA
jgi:protein-tyrosine kinase